MKRIVLLIVIELLMIRSAFAHQQHAHVEITKEAYQLLKIYLGQDIPDMFTRLGDFPIGPGPWQSGLITNGAWREDEEDVVYHYSMENPPTLTGILPSFISAAQIYSAINNFEGPDYFSSVSHFWEADNGDNTSTTMPWRYYYFGCPCCV